MDRDTQWDAAFAQWWDRWREPKYGEELLARSEEWAALKRAKGLPFVQAWSHYMTERQEAMSDDEREAEEHYWRRYRGFSAAVRSGIALSENASDEELDAATKTRAGELRLLASVRLLSESAEARALRLDAELQQLIEEANAKTSTYGPWWHKETPTERRDRLEEKRQTMALTLADPEYAKSERERKAQLRADDKAKKLQRQLEADKAKDYRVRTRKKRRAIRIKRST